MKAKVSSSRTFTRPQTPCKANSASFSACYPPESCPTIATSAQGGAVSATDVAMQQVPADIWAAFERRLDEAQVPTDQRPDYHKWVRFYFHFCHKYGHSPALSTSLGPFLAKLASKNQSVGQRSQASAAVRLLNQAGPEPGAPLAPLPATPARNPPATLGQTLGARSSPLPPPAPRAAQAPPPPPPAQPRIPKPPRVTGQDRPIAPFAEPDGALSPTSNIQHRTSNIEHPTPNLKAKAAPSVLDAKSSEKVLQIEGVS